MDAKYWKRFEENVYDQMVGKRYEENGCDQMVEKSVKIETNGRIMREAETHLELWCQIRTL